MRMSVRIVRPLVQAHGHGRAATLPSGFHNCESLPPHVLRGDDKIIAFS
jgi:hypothetical protein